MRRLKRAAFYLVFGLLLVVVMGFLAAPEYCSGRVDGQGLLVYDSDDRVVSDCTPWLRYLVFGHRYS